MTTEKTNVLGFNRARGRTKTPHTPATRDASATIDALLREVGRTNPEITIAELEARLDDLVENGLVDERALLALPSRPQ